MIYLFGAAAAVVFTLIISKWAAEGTVLFKHRTSYISDMYPIPITPSARTFIIWPVIFLLQSLWIGQALYFTFVENISYVASPATCIGFIFLSLANWTWLILWDRELIFLCALVIPCLPISGWYAAFHAVQNLSSYGSSYSNVVYKFILVTQVNGLATYAAWTSLATTLNLTIALTYSFKLDRKFASMLGLTAVAGLVYYFEAFQMANSGFASMMVSPYLVLMWATHGIWAKQRYALDSLIPVICFVYFVGAIGLSALKFQKLLM